MIERRWKRERAMTPGQKAAATKRRTASQLVCQQLENISRDALDKYRDIIRHYIRRRNGVYALYKREKLYYVGLATNLRTRLKQHLDDRHGESWDRFSVYLTIGDRHLKEMESLLLRIAHPTGNKHIGRFVKCENLVKRFARDIKTLQREEITAALGLGGRKVAGRDAADERPVLAPYVKFIRRNRLRARYKGTWDRARVRSDGTITVRGSRGRKFNSPSMATIHIVKRNMNGWWFWHYERSPGEWVRLKHHRD
jgi:predicted GIY-YIG superfamily endonuclease